MHTWQLTGRVATRLRRSTQSCLRALAERRRASTGAAHCLLREPVCHGQFREARTGATKCWDHAQRWICVEWSISALLHVHSPECIERGVGPVGVWASLCRDPCAAYPDSRIRYARDEADGIPDGRAGPGRRSRFSPHSFRLQNLCFKLSISTESERSRPWRRQHCRARARAQGGGRRYERCAGPELRRCSRVTRAWRARCGRPVGRRALRYRQTAISSPITRPMGSAMSAGHGAPSSEPGLPSSSSGSSSRSGSWSSRASSSASTRTR